MNLYYELLRYPTFSLKEVKPLYANEKTARNALEKLLKEKLAVKIRNGLYTCISGENGGPVANRFQIASAINETSCVSHHTAFEYYGITDQIIYDVYVSSDSRFHDFAFDGYTYHYVKAKLNTGIVTPPFGGGVKVTDKERTIVDSIRDMNLISGLEETVTCITSLNQIDEKKLLIYLKELNHPFTYQKIGFILETYQDELQISDAFLSVCREKIGNSKRYLTTGILDPAYSGEWKLVYPRAFKNIKNGVEADAAI